MLRLAVALCAAGSVDPALSLSIELKDASPDRIERQRATFASAAPLPATPDVASLDKRLAERGLTAGAPILIRVFKAQSELELWMRKGERFELFATYPICQWSGGLGPKLSEGDRQTPEGFYTVTRRQLHRIGRWPRSLNLGFPNAFDRAHARTGSYILIHGGCTSVGCFAMTNPVMSEVYGLVTKAIDRGQSRVPVHVFPFRMTAAELDSHRGAAALPFWQNLKEGYDAFNTTFLPPRIGVCGKRYTVSVARPGDDDDDDDAPACRPPRS